MLKIKSAKKQKAQVPILYIIKSTVPIPYLNMSLTWLHIFTTPGVIEVGRTPLVLGTIAIAVAALKIVGSWAMRACAGRDQPKKKASIAHSR